MIIYVCYPGRQHSGITAWDIDKKEFIDNITINIPIAKARKQCTFSPQSYRLFKIGESLGKFILTTDGVKNGIAFMENYIYDFRMTLEDFRKMDKQALLFAEVHGVIMYTFQLYNIPCIKIPPTRLKRFVTGNGDAEKSDMMLKINNLYGYDFGDDHQYDAAGLVHIGRHYMVFAKDPYGLDGADTYRRSTIREIAEDNENIKILTMLRTQYNIKEPVNPWI